MIQNYTVKKNVECILGLYNKILKSNGQCNKR